MQYTASSASGLNPSSADCARTTPGRKTTSSAKTDHGNRYFFMMLPGSVSHKCHNTHLNEGSARENHATLRKKTSRRMPRHGWDSSGPLSGGWLISLPRILNSRNMCRRDYWSRLRRGWCLGILPQPLRTPVRRISDETIPSFSRLLFQFAHLDGKTRLLLESDPSASAHVTNTRAHVNIDLYSVKQN